MRIRIAWSWLLVAATISACATSPTGPGNRQERLAELVPQMLPLYQRDADHPTHPLQDTPL